MSGPAEREMRKVWMGPVSAAMADRTRYLDVEGAFRSGKTTMALWKVLTWLLDWPGMHYLICRWSAEDTRSKLKPVWRQVLLEAGVPYHWNAQEKYDELPGKSRCYIFGLKAPEIALRYAKFRGLTLAGIYVDQTEELPFDVHEDLKGRLSQRGYPQQLLYTPNPTQEGHWLTEVFPEDRAPQPDHRLIQVSLYDNAHNLDEPTIAGLEAAYPPGHAKHRPGILGQRGMNVSGKPVYGPPQIGAPPVFLRGIHERPTAFNPALELLESIDFGKRHPCLLWAQYSPYGGLVVLGGIMGLDLFLEDVVPIWQTHREQWFPGATVRKTCCDPAGSHHSSQGLRGNGVDYLKEQWNPTIHYVDNSNAPDVRTTAIQRLAGYMRQRTAQGEAFAVDKDRFLVVAAQAVRRVRFLADGCEAGYVWSPHYVSVGNKQFQVPTKDGYYEHGQNCLEYLEINYGRKARKGTEPKAPAPPRPRLPASPPGMGWMG